MIHAMKPVIFGMNLISATAEARPMVAMVPLSKYLKGLRVLPLRSALMSFATYLPPWIAGWANCGS